MQLALAVASSLRVALAAIGDRSTKTPRRLFAFHADRTTWELTLDIVKGSDFRSAFGVGTPERAAIAKYEAAVVAWCPKIII